MQTTGDTLATGERMDEYGHPSDAFDRIAGLWSAYLGGIPLDARDVGAMMILLKVSRLATSVKPDTLDDVEGYVACIRMLDQTP